MRTPGFYPWRAAMRRAVNAQASAQGVALKGALSRRSVLALGAAMTAAGCAGLDLPSRRKQSLTDPVAIVGGGTAGLTAALRLQQAGIPSQIFESSNRLGGRMFTRRNFTAEGQFCELGGELVDSNHTSLRALAKALGVGIQRLAPAEGTPAHDTYVIGGVRRTARDMYDASTGKGAFIPYAKVLAAHQAKLLDDDDNWTPFARQMDQMSLATYLATLAPDGEPWVRTVLDLAYTGQFGLATTEQSALNLIDFIAADTTHGFEIFGESDEAYRVEGGSGTLPDAIVAALGPQYPARLNHALSAITASGEGFVLDFADAATPMQVRAQQVILALPFTRLRTVQGIDALGLSADKLKAIREFKYGRNTKLMTGVKGRPASLIGETSSGTLYSDTGFQVAWDTSRGQPGMGGVLTNFLGAGAADTDETSAAQRLANGLATASPALARALDPATRVMFAWGKHPHTLGSYSAPGIGQYTTLAEVTGTPELKGRLHFAGEHTSSTSQGYMDGAVESGERAARDIRALVV